MIKIRMIILGAMLLPLLGMAQGMPNILFILADMVEVQCAMANSTN